MADVVNNCIILLEIRRLEELENCGQLLCLISMP